MTFQEEFRMKKRMLSILLTAVMTLSLTAAATAAEDSADHEPVTLRFYNYALSESDKADWWDKTIEQFEAENDWIDIETIAVDVAHPDAHIATHIGGIAGGCGAIEDHIVGTAGP